MVKRRDAPKFLSRRKLVVGGSAVIGLAAGCTSTKLNAQERMSNLTLKTAHKAFQFFSQGVASGEFTPFLKMLTDDCTARLPVARFQSPSADKDVIAAYFQFISQDLKVRATVTPVSVTSNENTVGFEFLVKGTAAGKPTNTQNTVFFDVRGNKITGFREYFGN